MKTITLVAGARPNFMKIAPILRALELGSDVFKYRLVHTGQHFDEAMNFVFFKELGIPKPDVHFNGSGGSHAEQTARIMVEFEADCLKNPTDMVLVVGDVNSTLACAIVAKKLHIPVAHVEAGLRSGDMSMPEEINRRATDSISDIFFVTEPSGIENLIKEGHPVGSIFHVGNVMVDNLFHQIKSLSEIDFSDTVTGALKSEFGDYGVVTLHRPSNVDNEIMLRQICQALTDLSANLPLVFPVHPRTKNQLKKLGISLGRNVRTVNPLPYMEFLNLWKDSRVILTDSGGLQEESTALGVPCLTLRDNTERPITVTEGTNVLIGGDMCKLKSEVDNILSATFKKWRRPDLWDGQASLRIIESLRSILLVKA